MIDIRTNRRDVLRTAGVLLACSLFALALAQPASADTWTFTGPAFSYGFTGGDTAPPLTGISGTITFDAALASLITTTGLTDVASHVTSYSFTDGVGTITNLSFHAFSADFSFEKNASGIPDFWDIGGISAGFPGGATYPFGTADTVLLYTTNSGAGCLDSTSETVVATGHNAQAFGTCLDSAGFVVPHADFWSLVTTSTSAPEPGTLPLLATGLAALVAVGLQKKALIG
jgi:hypothetical protein